MPEAGEITRLLGTWSAGSEVAAVELMPIVYDDLRRLASSHLRRERRNHTLETGALVHEAYLRLLDQKHVSWENRGQFFCLAARLMRRILIDHARRHRYAKRGSGVPRLSLDETLTLAPERAPELIALDDALSDLAAVSPRLTHIVELRFFAGLTSQEIAQALGISVPTVTRGWRTAKAWLYRHLSEGAACGARALAAD